MTEPRRLPWPASAARNSSRPPDRFGYFVTSCSGRARAAAVRRGFPDLRSFWFDTALSGGPSALPSLLVFVRPDQVLFGTDWPFAPEIAVAVFTGEYDHYVGPGTSSHHAIDRNNAHALFPRLS
ncbi:MULTISPECIES: amidohydrolase family protein [Streptomyces]|uniref:amidohydrolase family protein n=1 Tax=Streptomyces TaxID=1883 RepID=UPI0029BAD24C|nr:amidohydrolase family protein [Streptomyces sp. AK02-04a]MDX3762983.1 amidohydrolase family protein [Streptomyces sp. AK02-04a]